MELRHLRYFAAVAETQHFGQAAERLHIAQSALSQAIRQLEKDLGVTLFTRTTRQVTLTAAGEYFREEAERTLGAIEHGVRGVRRIADGREGLVRIALTGTSSFTLLPQIARAVQKWLPDIALEIHADLLTPEQSSRLEGHSLDLGVLRPPVNSDQLRSIVIERESLILAVPAGHPLASEPVVSMSRLRGEGFVMYASDQSAVNSIVRRSCEAAGFTPRRDQSAPSTAVLLALVAAGLGVSVVPHSARAIPLAGVEFCDLVDADTVDLVLAWRGDEHSPAVINVIKTLRRERIIPATDADLTMAEVRR